MTAPARDAEKLIHNGANAMDEAAALRDGHRLFGLLLSDFFTDSPFVVEIERDLSQQQQFLDVVVIRRRRGRFAERLPDGLDDLTAHNLITFKSHRETLDDCVMVQPELEDRCIRVSG